MLKKLLTLTLIASALSACGNEKPQPENKLLCDSPAVVQNVRINVQEIIKQEAQNFANSDTRQFVDADKIIAAATQLSISLENPVQETNDGTPICKANLNIKIPDNIYDTAQTNSPLLYGERSIEKLVQSRISGTPLSYDKGTFSRPLRYTPSAAEGQTAVNYEDNALTATAQTIATALLPYGIKSLLMINGQAVSLEDALKPNQPTPEPPPIDPLDILENNAASEAVESSLPESPAPEVLTPETRPGDISFSANELEQARSNNQASNNEINRIWNTIDKSVQKELLEDQREWIQNKNLNCRRAAAQAETTLQAEYLQLQCDTRMTRERSQYLQGYSIN